MTLPFVPLPTPVMRSIAKKFLGFGEKIENMFPAMKEDLYQANVGISSDEYGGIIFITTIFYFIFFSIMMALVLGKLIFTKFILGTIIIPHSILFGLGIGLVMGLLVFIQLVAYPKILIKKKVREIDSNLVFALRTMLVQIRSGVSLFSALGMIATSKRFGALGEEMKTAIDSINTGKSEEKALEEMARKNPSAYLRKAIWQILNGMKAGADISDVVGESVNTMVREQRIAITKYGGSLRMLSLVYLMIGVILPALGITFLIVIGSFPKIQISEAVFWGMLGGTTLIEFMFIGVMKSQRPGLMGD